MIRNITLLCLALLTACGSAPKKAQTTTSVPQQTTVKQLERSTVATVTSHPHATDSYTQGLLISDGKMYESIGEYGHSALRVTDITTGEVEREVKLSKDYFGEGLALRDGKLYQLTWLEEKCFVYDINTLKLLETITYKGEGWGLESYKDGFLLSDGSSTIKYVDPRSFKTISTIQVHDNRGSVNYINELEMVDSLLYANIYGSSFVAVIDPESGRVQEYIDCSELYFQIGNRTSADVLNGIAFDRENRKLYFTGKLWDTLFEVANFETK